MESEQQYKKHSSSSPIICEDNMEICRIFQKKATNNAALYSKSETSFHKNTEQMVNVSLMPT